MPDRPQAAILTYHSLDDSGSVLSTSPRLFARQMEALVEMGARVVGLKELASKGASLSGGERLVAITFDDGFQNLLHHAVPILQRHGFPATVFLVTDYCGSTNSWPGQPPHVQRRPLLDWGQVAEMSAAGIAFGSHTRTHPNLRAMTRAELEGELIDSKKKIEDTLGRPVETLAYPYGAYDPEVVRIAAAHYSVACSTTLGFCGPASPSLALERLDTFYLRSPAIFHHLFSPRVAAYLGLRRLLRRLRGRS